MKLYTTLLGFTLDLKKLFGVTSVSRTPPVDGEAGVTYEWSFRLVLENTETFELYSVDQDTAEKERADLIDAWGQA